jgi:mono/diheme cytochrome c family protein
VRHVISNIFVIALTGLLVLGSLVFMRIRSAQVVISDEATVYAMYEHQPADRELEQLREQSYAANCRPCHGAAGRGWDQYPPLTGMSTLAAAPGGRDYLIALHLFGVASPRWRAPMPPMKHMPDALLAAAINYMFESFGNEAHPVEPITPAEIAARRADTAHPADIARLRPAL